MIPPGLIGALAMAPTGMPSEHLGGWWVAEDVIPVEAGVAVAAWPDRSGHGRTLAPYGGGFGGDLEPTAANGRPAVYCHDGESVRLLFPAEAPIPQSEAGVVFAVVQLIDLGPYYQMMAREYANNGPALYVLDGSGSQWATLYWDGPGGSHEIGSGLPAAVDTWVILAWAWGPTQISVWVNGVLEASQAVAKTNVDQWLWVFGQSGQGFRGRLAELAIYEDDLSPGQMARAFAHLGGKYDIP